MDWELKGKLIVELDIDDDNELVDNNKLENANSG